MRIEDFHGPNAAYVIDLFERYRQNPRSVNPETRMMFEHWSPLTDGHRGEITPDFIYRIMGAVNLAQSIRAYGHRCANLDPLGATPPNDPELDPAVHGLIMDDLEQLPPFLVGGPISSVARNAREAIEGLRKVYCSTSGHDYDHVHDPTERIWLRFAVESRCFRGPMDPIDPEVLLARLTQVEVFERFLQRAFAGKFRFSLEGLDMLVPMLDEILAISSHSAVRTMQLGMAHRGRLNVLAHILKKPYAQMMAEFKDPVREIGFGGPDSLGWTGDVKYHWGSSRAWKTSEPVDMIISMAPNPSHLEAVNPVVVGMARAAGANVDQPGPVVFDAAAVMPILIHGDAAFPGQGVVAETLNMSRLPGYQTGGTVHIITNNQLGFTTVPGAHRSTLYASDLAKGFEVPIIHVNADDPEACIEAARLAFAYRMRFKKDFLIDLIGYRRHGHNEADEPGFTQPAMYRFIEKHPTVRQLWGDRMIREGTCTAEHPRELVDQYMQEMQEALDSITDAGQLIEPHLTPPHDDPKKAASTAVPAERLREINRSLWTLPEDFNIHPKLEKLFQRRLTALDHDDQPEIDWSTAEMLALATVLADGTAVRLTGQDAERGTFSQRHAVLHDVENGTTHMPLQTFSQARAACEIRNSPLTENAAIGFEYGYNIQAPKRLVIWEAQYGDFINGAQTMIDEFVTSARAKWGLMPSLVLLLPHAYEGQGPDHSSARPERFVRLAVENNIRIANCTTAAQYFHLLRRQALLLEKEPLPLVVLTPKSLLRHPKIASSLRELAEGRFQCVIDDEQAQGRKEGIKRLIFCSGKIYVDLVMNELRGKTPEVAIVRLEQLYPFPAQEIKEILNSYPTDAEVAWVQEEAENMGVWGYMLVKRFGQILGSRQPIRYIGRAPSSSPAEGSSAWHNANQALLLKQAYEITGIAMNGHPVIPGEENASIIHDHHN